MPRDRYRRSHIPIGDLPPGAQQGRVRRAYIQPWLRKLLNKGVRLHVLINAVRAELEDLEQIANERRNG